VVAVEYVRRFPSGCGKARSVLAKRLSKEVVGNLWAGSSRPQVFHSLRQARQIPQDALVGRRSNSLGEFRWPAIGTHRLSVEFEAIGIVDQTVEDRIAKSWFAECLMPVIHG
jgi:hypothetical protein